MMIASSATGKASAICHHLEQGRVALALAAAPTFLAMAVVTGGMPDEFCAAISSPLEGMTTMYLLMAAFHLPPWLKLAAR